MKTKDELEKIAKSIRKDILKMGYNSDTKRTLIGGGLSLVEILTVLYADIMNYNVRHPFDANRDRFVLSKAHSAMREILWRN